SVDSHWLHDLFNRIDKDNSGSISNEELQQALTNGSGTTFNAETIRLMIGMFDKDNSGEIEFSEFLALWKYIMDWERTFRSYDKDCSGTIDKDELRVAFTSFGHNFSEEMLDMFVTKFDRSGQGAIRFDDFIQCCVVLQILTNAFKYHDQSMRGVITLRYEEFIRMILNLNLGKW
ncbi:programmed cell death protein 6-like, partial [Actinia tenebrosa]|uniref:Programmed cell death protein 6-like n=1 Tax=Actinia tenebrosa TaxID=6105 RepID=A0A6P8HZG3_ACTTE